jgi:hypothetical protein
VNLFSYAKEKIVCPFCGALPGEQCHTPSGRPTRDGLTHLIRWRMAYRLPERDFVCMMPSGNEFEERVELEQLYNLPDPR